MWKDEARPEQRQPNKDWHIWLIMAGRGFGKTRTGAETVLDLVDKGYKNIGFIGQTIQEVWRVMVYGVSGLSSCFNQRGCTQDLLVKRIQRQIIMPKNQLITVFSGDCYDQLRGPQFDLVWIDELAKFKYPSKLWEQVMLSLRLGCSPKCIITTTPRPIPLLHTLAKAPYVDITQGSTFDNKNNLSPMFIKQVKDLYHNTRIGAQELNGELLDHVQGALWKPHMIMHKKDTELYKRKVLAIDPALTGSGDETGIILAAKDMTDKGVVLGDFSGSYTPEQWGQRVIHLYHEHKVDCLVIEANQGGGIIERMLKDIDNSLHIKSVRATHGKLTRAEPVSALYERGLISHSGYFQKLEYQMTNYNALEKSFSPDRLDALVWALWELFLSGNGVKRRILPL